MKKNKLEDSLNKLFSNSGYKMVDVSEKNITHRKALATGEIVLGSEVIKLIKNKKILLSQNMINTTINNKESFEKKWILPLKNSWITKFL